VVHLARPRIAFTDHGKTAVVIPGCKAENADCQDEGGEDE